MEIPFIGWYCNRLISSYNANVEHKNAHWGPCRIASELLYAICTSLHLRGDYKINIIHSIRSNGLRRRGHAWVTRNDKGIFLAPIYRPHAMSKIGESEKYCYWVAAKQNCLKRVKKNPVEKV